MLNLVRQICNAFRHPIQAIQNKQKDCWIKCLPDELIMDILSRLSAEALSAVRLVNHQWKELASEDSLWKRLLQEEMLVGRVRNLDQSDLTSIGFPQVSALTADPRKLLRAAKIACQASENGSSTILTIPSGWSWDKLEELIKTAERKRIIFSVNIQISNELKELLRQTSIQNEQTVILTDTVINHSRYKSVDMQKDCLKASGFENELPDALTVITTIIMTHIFNQGQKRLYICAWTRCSNKTAAGNHLLVGSVSSGALVDTDKDLPKSYRIGTGGQRKLMRAIKV